MTMHLRLTVKTYTIYVDTPYTPLSMLQILTWHHHSPTSPSQLTIMILVAITATHLAVVHPSSNVLHKILKLAIGFGVTVLVFLTLSLCGDPFVTTPHMQMQEKLKFLETTLMLYLPTYVFGQLGT